MIDSELSALTCTLVGLLGGSEEHKGIMPGKWGGPPKNGEKGEREGGGRESN